MLAAKTRRLVPIAALVAVAAGCAGGPALRGGRFVARDAPWSIAAPPAAWRRVEAEGAALAFARGDGASMALAVRCRGVARPLEALARELRSGLGPHALAESRALALAGRDAVLQSLVLRDDGHVRAVTRAAPPCVQDFVLVTTADDPAAVRDFDAWWASFEEPVP